MIKAVIFDMDGTVLNTIDDIRASVNYALAQFNYPLKSLQEIKMGVGNGAYHLIKTVLPNDLEKDVIDEIFKVYQTHYDQYCQVHTKPYKGTLKMLKTLKKSGYKVGVVSNKYEYLVKALNDEMFESSFDVAIGEVEGIPIKPAPDMLFKAVKHLNVTADETVFIGDSETDLKTAKNAKIKVIAVTWGYRDKETLEKYEPEAMIDDVNDIIKTIERISSL